MGFGFLFLFYTTTATSGPGLPHYRGFAITHTQYDSSGLLISPTKIPLLDSTELTQETDINVVGLFRTRNPRKPVVADTRLWLCGYWDRHKIGLTLLTEAAWSCKRRCIATTMHRVISLGNVIFYINFIAFINSRIVDYVFIGVPVGILYFGGNARWGRSAVTRQQ